MSNKDLRRGEVLGRVQRGELKLTEASELLEVSLPRQATQETVSARPPAARRCRRSYFHGHCVLGRRGTRRQAQPLSGQFYPTTPLARTILRRFE